MTIDHTAVIATLELIESHARLRGRPARFVYLDVLGGDDVAVVIVDDDHLELRARKIGDRWLGDRSEITVVATSLAAIERLDAALADLYLSLARGVVLARVQRALAVTRERWDVLAAQYPHGALAEVQGDARRMAGHAIGIDGPPEPTYGASVPWGPTRQVVPFVDGVPVAAATAVVAGAALATGDGSRWWHNLGCDVPCELPFDLGCFDALPGLDALDCGCDLGCL